MADGHRGLTGSAKGWWQGFAAGYAVVGTALRSPIRRADYLTVRAILRTRDRPAGGGISAGTPARIDSLINNAGVFIGKPFEDYTVDDYGAVTAVNLDGFFHITQRRSVRWSPRERHIVNVTTSLVEHADSKRPSALAP